MLKHKEMYAGVLHRLDKVGAGSVDLVDFNYHMNETIRRRVAELVPLIETDARAQEHLQALENRYIAVSDFRKPELPLRNNRFPLPPDSLYVRNCIALFKATQWVVSPPYGPTYRTSVERVTPDRETAFERPGANYYNRPKVRRPYFRLGGNAVEILFGDKSGYELARVEGSYLVKPKRVALAPDKPDGTDVDGIDPESNRTSEFSDSFDHELINECAIDIMVRFSDDRVQAAASLRQQIP